MMPANEMSFMIKNKKQSGFTLIEVMIVVVIVAVLAGIAIANYQGASSEPVARLPKGAYNNKRNLWSAITRPI